MIYCLNMEILTRATVVMILRVWVLYNRSRYLLGTLLTLFSLEMISYTLAAVIRSNPRNLTSTFTFLDNGHASLTSLPLAGNLKAGTVLIYDIVICFAEPLSPIFPELSAIFEFTHGSIVFLLAVVQFVRQSLQMHRATKQWKPNRYMSLLVGHDIPYFFVYVHLPSIHMYPLLLSRRKKLTKTFSPSVSLLGLLNLLGELPPGGLSLLLAFILNVPVYTLIPRFVLNIREVYARDIQGTRGEGIDTRFGLSTNGIGVIGTEIAFAPFPNEGLEDDVLGTGSNRMDTGFGLSSSGRGTTEMATMCADVERNERLEVVEVSRATGTTRLE